MTYITDNATITLLVTPFTDIILLILIIIYINEYVNLNKRIRWLREDEWKWAANYLREKSADPLIRRKVNRSNLNYSDVAGAVELLEETSEGRELSSRLKNALRQRRYRSEHHNRKSKTFRLTVSTLNKIRTLANNQEVSETEIIASAIDNADELKAQHKNEIKDIRRRNELRLQKAQTETRILKKKFDVLYKEFAKSTERLIHLELSYKEITPNHVDKSTVNTELKHIMKSLKRHLEAASLPEYIEQPPEYQEILRSHSISIPDTPSNKNTESENITKVITLEEMLNKHNP